METKSGSYSNTICRPRDFREKVPSLVCSVRAPLFENLAHGAQSLENPLDSLLSTHKASLSSTRDPLKNKRSLEFPTLMWAVHSDFCPKTTA